MRAASAGTWPQRAVLGPDDPPAPAEDAELASAPAQPSEPPFAAAGPRIFAVPSVPATDPRRDEDDAPPAPGEAVRPYPPASYVPTPPASYVQDARGVRRARTPTLELRRARRPIRRSRPPSAPRLPVGEGPALLVGWRRAERARRRVPRPGGRRGAARRRVPTPAADRRRPWRCVPTRRRRPARRFAPRRRAHPDVFSRDDARPSPTLRRRLAS